jgi:hypothetical protein
VPESVPEPVVTMAESVTVWAGPTEDGVAEPLTDVGIRFVFSSVLGPGVEEPLIVRPVARLELRAKSRDRRLSVLIR